MDAEIKNLSVSELYVIGKKRYSDNKTGLENWKDDLLRFVSQDFHDSLNSSNRNEQTKADQELALWINTTYISYFFRNTWGNESDNQNIALQCLHNAQILERKFDDQYIIQAINRAIRVCLDNSYNFIE